MGSNNNGHDKDLIAYNFLQMQLDDLKRRLEDHEDRDYRLMEQITETQRMLSERLAVLEANQNNISAVLTKMSKENSTHNKLLVGVILALVSASITIIVRFIYGG